MHENKCFIISEIGVNHNGDIKLAKKMIEESKNAGADAVKFQTFTAESLVSRLTPKVKYQKTTTNKNESHYEMIKSLEISKADHIELINFCKENQIEFMSTPYDIESAKFLNKAGVEKFKTASADIVDIPLHQYLAETGKPVIISTGMSTLDEIDQVVEIYKLKNNLNVTLLHCVSNYPCNHESLNLSVITLLRNRYDLNVGYSDHAEGFLPAVAAVILGSTVIEKHFTIDKGLAGPDHKASSSPSEFKELVNSVRLAEKFIGKPRKEIQEEEKEMRLISRKSIFYSRNLKKGHIIKNEDLTLKRPGTGLYAKKINEIIGSKLKFDVSESAMVKRDDLK